ncbi:tetratricopeptide repeat protein [Streptomyces sp. NPDC007905]|uniref:tetratricopeptide repeat protein n=1 Tax=Streptomyces sp. NPDC007905 TaxID=3364788 RepID=UPI0036E51F37
MDPLSPAVLAKVAGPVAGRFGMSTFQKLTRGRRVARAAAKRATAAGVAVRAKSLRVWLSRTDTAEQLRQCTESSLEQAAQRLVYLVPGRDGEQRRLDALRVLRIVMEEYVRSVSPQEAALFTGEWGRQSAIEDGSRTREAVLASRDDVLGRLEARSDFDATLRTLSPWSSQEARRLRAAWPAVETAVGLLAEVETERGAVLQGWAVEHPAWLQQAPAQALGWLGQVASEYGMPLASRVFFEGCLREGGYPRDYLVARAALHAGSGTEHEVREYLDAHEDAASPLLGALRDYLNEDWAGCLRQLARWEPHNALADSLRVQLEAEALTHAGRGNEALALLRAANQETQATGTAVRLAVALLQHAVHHRTPTRLADAQEALAVSVRARNSRRAWYGDSTEAALLAVQAAVLCGDLSAAWSLTQPPPEGEALPHEAADGRLQEQTALVAALSGREQEAERLLEGMTNAFAKAHVTALIAEVRRGGDTENPQVRGLWLQVWEAASTEQEQLIAAMGLAEAGADLPDLTHLTPSFPEAVGEIELLARALKGSSGDGLAVLRANVTRSPLIVLKLAQRYHRGGDLQSAAQTLRDGADHWRDVRLMAMAAGLFRASGSYASARECADAALRMAGADWAGQGRMYALLVEVESADGRMDQATNAALQLLALDPMDCDARWALARCYAARAMPEQAWQTLTEQGTPMEPRSRDEALLWIGLGSGFSVDAHFTGRALALMQRWPDDEDLLGRLLGALHSRAAEAARPLTQQDADQLRAATENYLERFPASTVFRAVSVGPPENPLENLTEELRSAYEHTKEVREKVAGGELPVGLLSLAAGRTYAETCIRRTAERPVVYAADIPVHPAETRAVQAALSGRVVLDTSAASTLALLEPGMCEQFVGHLRALTTTDQLLADALKAKESITLRSDMTLAWDEHSTNPTVLVSAPEDLAALRSAAARLVDIMQTTPRVSRPELRSLPQLTRAHGTAWLTAVDYAKEHGLVLWCDDRVLRAVARAQGVAAFGTLSLLDACVSGGMLTPEEGLVVKAELLRNYFVDIPFSARLYRVAAQTDGWQAKAVAVAVSRPTAWADPQAASAFALDAASRSIGPLPHEASGWLSAAYAGLHRATPPSHRRRNLQVLILQALTQPWVTTSSLPFVLAGLRTGIDAVTDSDASLRAALAQYYGALADKMGYITAASVLMNLFALTDETDKAVAARTVLTHQSR